MNILIAEDEPALRENLQWMLEMEGYEVRVACDGLDALERARHTRPDLILSDVMMPRLDGYELLRALREDPATATIPVIMLTAKADLQDVRAGMNLGADDYLTKPCRREDMLEAIRARLVRSALQDRAAQRLQDEARVALKFDTLTALPNRVHFDEMLSAAMAFCQGQQHDLLVICLGMDGFAKVNESMGAHAGDLVLKEVARRLNEHLGARGTALNQACVARLNGDLFALCLTGVLDAVAAEQEALTLLARLANPYRVSGQSLFLTASAGASLHPEQAHTAQELVLNAESALHQAKVNGPNAFRFFDAQMNLQVTRKLQLHNELHQAIELNQLQIFYQPQISIKSGALVGFEALLRWHHAKLGWISPSEFIPIAEESGIIVRLGEWVLRMAAAQAAKWLALGHKNFRMAVNLSVRQFADLRLSELVRQVLLETALPPNMLELEVTESLALQSITSTVGTLNALKALGIKLAMDDFGTGYSSLAYLKRYPLDALKIDQAFVRNITRDAGDAAIARAIVAMAHSFGMSVVAEGVETDEQLAFLRELGCEEFQGYLFSRPVTADQAVACFAGFKRTVAVTGVTTGT